MKLGVPGKDPMASRPSLQYRYSTFRRSIEWLRIRIWPPPLDGGVERDDPWLHQKLFKISLICGDTSGSSTPLVRVTGLPAPRLHGLQTFSFFVAVLIKSFRLGKISKIFLSGQRISATHIITIISK